MIIILVYNKEGKTILDIWPQDSGRIEIYPNNPKKGNFKIIKIRCKEKLEELCIEECIKKRKTDGFVTDITLSPEEAVLAMVDAIMLMCNALDNN